MKYGTRKVMWKSLKVADFQTCAYVQAVIIQPLGEDGVLIAASNTIRGYTSRDKVNFCILPLLQNHCCTPSSYNQCLLSHGSKLGLIDEMGSWKCAGMDCNDWRKTRHHIDGLGFVFFFFFLKCDCCKPAGLKKFPEKEVILQLL